MSYLSYLWIFMIIITAIVEAMTAGVFTIWFTIGSVASFLVSLVADNIYIQLVVFFAVSILCLIFTRPLVKNKILIKKEKTNADAVLGKSALVTEDIDPVNGLGQVKVEGKIWSAKSDSAKKIGETVEVVDIQGVKLLVK